jgi:hypothetical protein
VQAQVQAPESVHALWGQAPVSASVAFVMILMFWMVTLTLVSQEERDEVDYP